MSESNSNDMTIMPTPETPAKNADETVPTSQREIEELILRGYHSSRAIPLLEEGELRYGILYASSNNEPGFGTHLGTPKHMIVFNPPGEIVRVRRYSEKERETDEEQRSGMYLVPEGIDPNEFARLRKHDLVVNLEKLMPDFQKGNVQVSAEVKAAAKEYKRIFELVSEPSLRIDYYREGKQFFDWLDTVLATP